MIKHLTFIILADPLEFLKECMWQGNGAAICRNYWSIRNLGAGAELFYRFFE